MKSIGAMVMDASGSRSYDENLNPLLVRRTPENPGGLTSTTGFWKPVTAPRHNDSHATPDAAASFVRTLNAARLRDSEGNVQTYSLAAPEKGYGGFGFRLFGYVEWSTPMELIERPDGEKVPAGQIGYVLGQEAAWANERMRDWEIYKLLGFPAGQIDTFVTRSQSGLKPWLSDTLIDAAMAAVRIA